MPISFHIPTMVFQIINVLIVMFILNKILYKPVAAMIQKREAFVENSLSQASATKREAENLLAEYQKMLANARQDADALIVDATRQAEEIKKQAIAKAEEEAQKIFQRARQDIQKEKEKVLMEIRSEIAGLTVFATSKLLDRVITVDDNERIVQSCVDQLDTVIHK